MGKLQLGKLQHKVSFYRDATVIDTLTGAQVNEVQTIKENRWGSVKYIGSPSAGSSEEELNDQRTGKIKIEVVCRFFTGLRFEDWIQYEGGRFRIYSIQTLGRNEGYSLRAELRDDDTPMLPTGAILDATAQAPATATAPLVNVSDIEGLEEFLQAIPVQNHYARLSLDADYASGGSSVADYNATSGHNPIENFVQEDLLGTHITTSSTGFTVTESGLYDLNVSGTLYANVTRLFANISIRVNGEDLPDTDSFYSRGSAGGNKFSASVSRTVNLSANDVITFGVERTGTSAGIATLDSFTADITAKASTVSSVPDSYYPTQAELQANLETTDTGYEFTGGFVDRTTGQSGANDIGSNVQYTSTMAQDGTWYRFGFSEARQAANDVAYFPVDDPTFDQTKGLFGGIHMPEGVSKLFDFTNTDLQAAVTTGDLQYTEATGSYWLEDCNVGDLVKIRFSFNAVPQVANSTLEVGLIFATRDDDGNTTFTFSLPAQPIYYGTGTQGQAYLNRVEMSAYIASDEDRNARLLPAIRCNNEILIQPLTTLISIVR